MSNFVTMEGQWRGQRDVGTWEQNGSSLCGAQPRFHMPIAKPQEREPMASKRFWAQRDQGERWWISGFAFIRSKKHKVICMRRGKCWSIKPKGSLYRKLYIYLQKPFEAFQRNPGFWCFPSHISDTKGNPTPQHPLSLNKVFWLSLWNLI